MRPNAKRPLVAMAAPASTLLLLLACQGGSTDGDAGPTGHGRHRDAAAADRGEALADAQREDAAPASSPDTSIRDTSILDSCPCPPDSYCDLTTNRCVAGCTIDDHCLGGKYCNQATKTCAVGCRGAADCSDDGNPCTDADCDQGTCRQVPNSASCADDGDVCTADQCQAGKCTHTTVPDGTDCPSSWGVAKAKCFGGTCYPQTYRCCSTKHLNVLDFGTGKYESPLTSAYCRCDGSKMSWRGWRDGSLEMSSATCDVPCESSGYCEICYSLP